MIKIVEDMKGFKEVAMMMGLDEKPNGTVQILKWDTQVWDDYHAVS